jgi:radical SAM/Cys-rich protein
LRLASLAASASRDFALQLERAGCGRLTRSRVTTLQLNITARCNLACHHCHVESGPRRTESMERYTADRVLELLASNPAVEVLDLTGGAPEMNDQFRLLVAGATSLGRRVIDRCNLTILFQPGHVDTARFLADHGVEIVASLPCYAPENVDRQRGRGVFDESIEALRQLNTLGYAQPGSDLRLRLVYNPVGAFLPPPQDELEERYRSELRSSFGIEFDSLYTLTNMPIKRFAHDLARDGRAEAYMALLVNHFNPATVPDLMCRSILSVDWDGAIYDCDFNQALGIPAAGEERSIWDLDDFSQLEGCAIATGPHCYGCTAGGGSSCGGSLA